jgi:hypothetical protein
MTAIARDAGIAKRDAGIARPALLGLSRSNIRNPVSRLGYKLVRGSAANNFTALPQTRQARRWGQRTPDHASRRCDENQSLPIAAPARQPNRLRRLEKFTTS